MTPLLMQDIALRLGLALLAGVLIGLERESHGRAAGLRTTGLVAVAAAVAMLLSEYYFDLSVARVESLGRTGVWGPDLGRLPAGILTGMGFLGAGVIMREGRIVRGVTTAAALWFTTVLGLAFGAGQIALGLIGLAIAVVILLVLPELERFIRNDWYGCVTVTLSMDGIGDADIRKRLEQMHITVKSVELTRDVNGSRRTVFCRIKYKNHDVFDLSERAVHELSTCPGVIKVEWA